MANIAPVVTYAPNGHRRSVTVAWSSIGDSDTPLPVELPEWADGSVQIEGTFGGATIAVQGSNDNANYRAITDPQGNAISKTSAAVEQMTEVMRYLKPVTSGGTGSSITVTMLLRKPN